MQGMLEINRRTSSTGVYATTVIIIVIVLDVNRT